MHFLIMLIVIVIFVSIEYSLGKMLRNAVVEIALESIKNKLGNALKSLLLDRYFPSVLPFFLSGKRFWYYVYFYLLNNRTTVLLMLPYL